MSAALPGPATAETGAGVVSIRGNQINVEAQALGQVPDLGGLNPYSQNTRSHSGWLYADPLKWPDRKPLGDGDWLYVLLAEGGYLATFGSTGTASFLEYGDWDEDPILNRFAFAAEHTQSAYYLEGAGGGIGRDDQYYHFSFGRYGNFDISAQFDSVLHVFATNARVLWDGAGTGELTLPAGLTAGENSLDEILTAFATTGESSLALERDKASLSLDVTGLERLQILINGSLEWRDGARAFGGTFTYPGFGQASETVEPVDYLTCEIRTALRFSGERYQSNLSYSGSFFRNQVETLIWENPGLSALVAPPSTRLTPERGRFALAPDNDYHSLRGEFAADLPAWRGRATASFAYSRMKQDSELTPPAIGFGVLGNPLFGVDIDLWNSLDALSTGRVDAEIEHALVHTKLTLSPLPRLALSGEFRYLDEDNDTSYTALNPLTGEYGYLALDGGLGAAIPTRTGIFDPGLPGSRVRYRNVPYAKDSASLTLGADYRFGQSTKLGASYEREMTEYSHREFEYVTSDHLHLQLTHRKTGLGTARLSYQYSKRRGDSYDFNPYEPFYTSSLPDFTSPFPDGNVPHTLSAMRKYDLSGRTTHVVDAKLNFILRDDMDVALSGRYERADFEADFGLRDTRSAAASVEWNYQFALNGSVYAFYSYQMHKRRIANINDAGPVLADAQPGGAVYPFDNAWSEDVDERNHALGTGLNVSLKQFTADLSYNYFHARSEFRYAYATPAAFLNLFSQEEVGNGFPAQTFGHHVIEGNLRWNLRAGLSLRLLYRYERERFDDFHYDGLVSPVVGTDIFLVAVPEDYDAHVLGLLVETSF